MPRKKTAPQTNPEVSPEAGLTVEIGGRTRALKFTTAAFTAVQVRYKVRYTFSMLTDPSIADVPILLLVGLLTDAPGLTLQTVVKWLEEEEAFDYFGFVMRAVEAVIVGLRMDASDKAQQDQAEASVEDMLAPLG